MYEVTSEIRLFSNAAPHACLILIHEDHEKIKAIFQLKLQYEVQSLCHLTLSRQSFYQFCRRKEVLQHSTIIVRGKFFANK